MTRQTAVAALVVLIFGGMSGWWLGRDAGAVVSPATSSAPANTTSVPPVASFVDPAETVLGPAVIVAKDLRLNGEEVVLEFDLANLAPVGDAASITRFLGFGSIEEVPPAELDTVYADKWALLTRDGDIPGTVATPEARTARFDVGSGFSLDQVTGVRLDSYGLLVPVDVAFDLDLGRETAEILPGISARLLAVTEQAGTIIQVEILSARSYNYDRISLAGVGPGWKAAVREAEGRPRWNLTFDSPQAPSPIRLRLHGAAWMTIESYAPVAVERASS